MAQPFDYIAFLMQHTLIWLFPKSEESIHAFFDRFAESAAGYELRFFGTRKQIDEGKEEENQRTKMKIESIKKQQNQRKQKKNKRKRH